ncbi:MAG: TCP-1/cpn60 chaperonin family protein [Nanoarchaeota archaeon]|nr:TCP-1/cpn60 chaperonin family protein [Nanoarchaeota archaeon]
MGDKSIQPVFILPENTRRESGKSAQRLNIAAGKLVGETVRTTLGPKGMDKMIVDASGDVIVTNDGVTILKEMGIEHPAAKMIVEIAKTQESEIGDGTTTAVVLAGELLKRAEELLDQEIHPTVIARGYRLAAEKALEFLEQIAVKVTVENKDILHSIAETAMTGKGAESAKKLLSELTVKAILKVKNANKIDRYSIRIEKQVGGSVEDSELIEGLVIDKEKVHSQMPDRIENARIALINAPLEVKSTEMDAKIQISDPERLQSFLDMEEAMIKKIVTKISGTGANVVFCQKGIDDMAQHFLAKKGIYACRRVSKSNLEDLSKATGAKIVMNVDDLSENDLGTAGIVEQVKTAEDEAMTFVRECNKAKTVTILVRGGSDHVIDEIKRALEDAVGDIVAALKNNKVVAGAGGPEMDIAQKLLVYADSLSGREQLAVRAFAQSMEVIPRTLAENAGLDPIDMLAELRNAHSKKEVNAGINVFSGKIMDAWKEGVIEPLSIKTQAISSATEVAIMILRIDDVILAGPEIQSQSKTI